MALLAHCSFMCEKAPHFVFPLRVMSFISPYKQPDNQDVGEISHGECAPRCRIARYETYQPTQWSLLTGSIHQASWWTTPTCDVTNGCIYKVIADEPHTLRCPLENREYDRFISNVVGRSTLDCACIQSNIK
jgi:hypothetical protein